MKITRKEIALIILLLLVYLDIRSQVPTDQDCLGAIPICQPLYHEDSSYTGSGNYTNEINTSLICLANEDNSVWYIFTAQTSGMLSFIITPEDTLDDWDWAVFDLTNASCYDIYYDTALLISCNSYGNFTGWYNGPTGASTAMGGTTNNNGPGIVNGPPWNADIPVIAGGTYVMLICNWSGSTHGYTLDLTPSTAKIFDDVPPYINFLDTPVICGATNLSIGFSEKILCNTVSVNDFRLRGPLMDHSIVSVVGNNCAQGGTQEKYFTINFSPPISLSGKYVLELVDSDGSVSDLCNNIAAPDSIVFMVGDVTDTIINIIHSTCGQNNGSATVAGSGGNGYYTYLWSTNPIQTSPTAINLGAGKYYVTVTSGGCIAIDSVEIFTTQVPVVSITPSDTLICKGDSVTVYADKGFVSYSWNNGHLSSDSFTALSEGSYYVVVTDSVGCVGMSDTAIIGYYPDPQIIVSPDNPVICQGDEITLFASGAETYRWFPSLAINDTTGDVVVVYPDYSIVYIVEGIDDNGCSGYTHIAVEVVEVPEIFKSDTAFICAGETVRLTPGYSFTSYKWQDGSSLPYLDVIEPGTYWVETDHRGCIASDTITLLACSELWVPNSFTPNGDGLNDVFKAYGSGFIKEFRMIIFDRWGSEVFISDNIEDGWDGTIKGKPASQGIYIWYITYKPTGNFSTDKKFLSGHVMLLK